MRSWFRVTARFENFEHSVRDKKTSHNVTGGGNNRDRTEHGGQCALVFSHQYDCADHGNRIQSVGQRHQRRMKKRRYAADNFETYESRQHEHIKTRNQIHLHRYFVSFCSATRGGSEKNSRIRPLTTSPSRVTRVFWTISSSRLSWSFPSLIMGRRNEVMFRAYI